MTCKVIPLTERLDMIAYSTKSFELSHWVVWRSILLADWIGPHIERRVMSYLNGLHSHLLHWQIR